MKVLLVDDDLYLAELICYALERDGYNVVMSGDGLDAIARWESEDPDLVLLDVRLPKLNGLEVCRRIREESTVPIIILSAAYEEDEVINGIKLGADDYVVKPFSPKQLSLRINAALRRTQANRYRQVVNRLQVGELSLDPESHEVTIAGQAIELTMLEFRILYMLAANQGRIVPYPRLIAAAWNQGGGDPSLIKTHISHIRSKLLRYASQTPRIEAVPTIGYRLRAD